MEPPPYQCIHCLRFFDFAEDMLTHVDNDEHFHDSDGEVYAGRYCCTVCLNRFDFVHEVKWHLDNCPKADQVDSYIDFLPNLQFRDSINKPGGSGQENENVEDWPPLLNAMFHQALGLFGEDVPDRWEKVAASIGDLKTPEQVKMRYESLFGDEQNLEPGVVSDTQEDELESNYSLNWNRQLDIRFEKALVVFEDSPYRWVLTTAAVGDGKTIEQVKKHYKVLVEDVEDIDLGLVPLPRYVIPSAAVQQPKDEVEEVDEEQAYIAMKAKNKKGKAQFSDQIPQGGEEKGSTDKEEKGSTEKEDKGSTEKEEKSSSENEEKGSSEAEEDEKSQQKNPNQRGGGKKKKKNKNRKKKGGRRR